MKMGEITNDQPLEGLQVGSYRAGASGLVLYVTFALMGFCTALLGATLPFFRGYWALTDRTSGLLFLMFFLGSSTGPLVTRGNMVYSIARGSALIGISGMALSFVHGPALFPVFYVYGVGVGITTTSITILRSARRAERRLRELNLLNVIWPVGALICPTVGNAVLRGYGATWLFLGLVVYFFALLGWMLLGEERSIAAVEEKAETQVGSGQRLPWMMAAMAFLAVGLESTTGSWIASYSHQLQRGFGAPVEAATIFWFGLLASRIVHSTTMLRRFSEMQQLTNGAILAAIGACMMVGLPSQWALLMAAFLTGFGVGPIYPTVLAIVLPRFAGTVIFLLAGLGGASLPWLTGMISAQAGTLRVGMLVPMVAALLVLMFTVRLLTQPREVVSSKL